MITPKLLQIVGANAKNAEIFAPLLEEARQVPGDAFNTITSKPGIAMLVSQLAHESGYFSTLEEDLNYQALTLKTLRNKDGVRYFTDEQANMYGSIKDARGRTIQRAVPRMVANLYYGGRMGNRGVHTEDGWDFRGSGLIQLTGRKNHTDFGLAVGKSAEQAAPFCRDPEGAVMSSLWYWRKHGLLVPASRGDVTRCTQIINGGVNGLQGRIALYRRALSALT